MRVVVVGGGLSGLFTAVELVAAGFDDVLVVERHSQPGGVAQTYERDGFLLEPAVGSFPLPHPHLSPILQRIGADVARADASAAVRFVYTGDRLIEVPASPRALIAPVLPLPAKIRALAEPVIRRGPATSDESLGDFCRRRFGGEAGRFLSWLMASGVYAGDPGSLSARSAFPILTALEEQEGSVVRGVLRRRRTRPDPATRPRIHFPVGGMAGLARSAVDFLGARYRGDFTIDSVRNESGRWIVEGDERLEADSVVISSRPEEAAAMVDPELAAQLLKAEAAPVVVVGLGGRGDSILPSGFGALIGPDEGFASLGILFESSYATDRAPEGSWLVKVIAGGASRPDLVDWDDDRLLRGLEDEAGLVLGEELDITFRHVIRHSTGIPQYPVGHARWLAGVDQMLARRQGLHLTGWGYRGVGITHLATDASLISEKIANH